MPIPSNLKHAGGEWSGLSRLHLSWLPEDQRITECETTANVRCCGEDGYVEIKYRWHYDDAWHDGTMLIAESKSLAEVTVGWCDSWHQSGAVMLLTGAHSDGGKCDVLGSYQVIGHPNWGWRMEIELDAQDELHVRMFNISPEGEEEWGVDAVYRRSH